jgi:hypothetical protein
VVGKEESSIPNQATPERLGESSQSPVSSQGQAFGGNAPSQLPAVRQQPTNTGYNHPFGQSAIPAIINHGANAPVTVHEPSSRGNAFGPHNNGGQPLVQNRGRALNGGASTQLRALRPAEPNNTGNDPAFRQSANPALANPSASPAACTTSLSQTAGPRTSSSTTNFPALRPEPLNLPRATVGTNWALGMELTGSQTQGQQPEPSDFQFHTPMPELDPFDLDFFRALFCPGTWHDGAHEDCGLTAPHRHGPNGGVYFPSAAEAGQMLVRARIADVGTFVESMRENTDAVARLEARMLAMENYLPGMPQAQLPGSGRAANLLLGVGQPLAPSTSLMAGFQQPPEGALDGRDRNR